MATAEKVMVTRRRRRLEAGIQDGGLGSLRAGHDGCKRRPKRTKMQVQAALGFTVKLAAIGDKEVDGCGEQRRWIDEDDAAQL
jgi:hypothetical protein